MTATSYNGYPVLTDRRDGPLPRLRVWKIPGTGRHLILRDGSAGFLLAYVALCFHERVEPIDRGVWDDWGYASRPVRGSTTQASTHASGTGMDLNATLHPLSRRGTFRPVQYAKTRFWLARVRAAGCWVRWGADYTNRADEMHFEVMGNLAAAEKAARKLMDTPRGRRILAANPGAKAVILS